MNNEKTKLSSCNLARDILESWDMDTLLDYAYHNLKKWLDSLSDEDYKREAEDFYGEDGDE